MFVLSAKNEKKNMKKLKKWNGTPSLASATAGGYGISHLFTFVSSDLALIIYLLIFCG